MNAGRLIVYAAAVLSGWGAVAWRESASHPVISNAAGKPDSAPRKSGDGAEVTTLSALRKPPAGSAGLARVAALVEGAPNIAAARVQILTWPPGAAREFALTLLDARSGVLDVEPLLPPSPNPYNLFQELEQMVERGWLRNGISYETLQEWVSTDPAAATAAILRAPNDRDKFVNIAVETMARSDPGAALEFQLQNETATPGQGAARAWTKLVTGDSPNNGVRVAPQQFLDRMTPEQQSSLFSTLAQMMDAEEPFDSSNKNPGDPLHRSDAAVLAASVLQPGKSNDGLKKFFTSLAQMHPSAADEARVFIQNSSVLSEAHTAALEAMAGVKLEELAQRGSPTADDINRVLEFWGTRLNHTALVEQNASTALTMLARAGEFGRANQYIRQFSDTDSRREAFTAILPQWMEKDPAAARAAFNAAPLTAMEREEWERHPSFLLNPAGVRGGSK